jgi:hypothetical protein
MRLTLKLRSIRVLLFTALVLLASVSYAASQPTPRSQDAPTERSQVESVVRGVVVDESGGERSRWSVSL